MDPRTLDVLELFSGIGGFRYGLQRVLPTSCSVRVTAVDINTTANQVYYSNFGDKPQTRNIAQLTTSFFDDLAADLWMLSPPCQPHTQASALSDRHA
jgi:tRNA (cytosine38-C5)-methyltransferase